jgi:hypothetical protein
MKTKEITLSEKEFTRTGNAFLTRRNKLGYKPYVRFNRPEKVTINGVATFTYSCREDSEVHGPGFVYSTYLKGGIPLYIRFW